MALSHNVKINRFAIHYNILDRPNSYLLLSVKSILCLIFLSSFSYALQTNVAESFQNTWQSVDFPWEIIALIAVLISFSFSALAFMFSKLFSSKDLEKLSKYEFLYAVSSLLLVVFMIGIIDVLATKSGQFVYILSTNLGNNEFDQRLKEYIIYYGYSPFSVANFYIDTTLNIAIDRYLSTYCIAFPFFMAPTINQVSAKQQTTSNPSFLEKVSDFFTSSDVSSQLTVGALNWIASSLRIAMANLSYLIYSLYFQRHLLVFIQSTMLTVFLPVGLVLRGFPLVRSIGNLLISIAIGLYFVYPLTYSLFITMALPGFSQVGHVFSSYYSSNCVSQVVVSLFNPNNIISIIHSARDNLDTASIANDLINKLVGELVVMGFVFPFLAAVITYTFIKSFGIILNADIQEFAEGLVKLI